MENISLDPEKMKNPVALTEGSLGEQALSSQSNAQNDSLDHPAACIANVESLDTLPQTEASSVKLQQPSPAPISDNPLDAPDAPRPEVDDNAKEDQEMTGVEDDSQKPDGSPEKDGVEQVTGEASEEQPEQIKTATETTAQSHLMQQTYSIILPSYSTWFDMHKIHEQERRALPEFFNHRNRSKTEAVYKDYRDFMINTYRLNPAEYLTVTACRRNLAGDIDPETRPSASGPPFTGHFRIKADTPRGLQPFQPAPGSRATEGKPLESTGRSLLRAYREASPQSKMELNLEIRRNIYDQNGKDVTAGSKEKQANGEDVAPINGVISAESAIEEIAKESKKAVHCYSCGIDCTRSRFHYARTNPDPKTGGSQKIRYDLCGNCFCSARAPSAHAKWDFVKMEDEDYTSISDRDKPWTDAELLRLLEALELFDENWDSITDHVESRTREECVTKFLQLEIEDPYLENTGQEARSYGALDQGRLPFGRTDTVMTVVGFLAGMSDPEVAAAAAGRSVAAIRQGLQKRIEAGIGGQETQGKGKEKESTMKSEDAMEVDAVENPQPTDNNEIALPDSAIAKQATSRPPSLETIALATSAARAGALASIEEREMTRLVSSAVNTMLQKLELKLQHFSEMEMAMQAERRELERGRQQLFLDRLAFRKRMHEVEEGIRAAAAKGGEEGARMARDSVGFGGGADRLEFERRGGHEPGDVQPLSTAGTTGYRNFEL
ncbi:MAG: hypothetical protein LQ350_007587 [Teloschistes chrysophthalmus]|nr:MAG: hypothetical protein LQ350_007587 [Niorma chrysophthalma]